MSTLIRGPEKGRLSSHQRAVHQVTRHPSTDALLADLQLASGSPAAEALGLAVARSVGRGLAEGEVFVPSQVLALATKLAGHSLGGAYYTELWDVANEHEDDRREELADKAVTKAKARLDELLVESRHPDEIDRRLQDCAELDLGAFFPGDPSEALPIIVGHLGFKGKEAEARIERFLPIAKRARAAASDNYARAQKRARADLRRERAERRADGMPRYSEYVINTKTGLATEDEEFEAAEIAKAEAEAIEAAIVSAEGSISFSRSQGASVGTMLLEAFIAAYQSHRMAIPVDDMVERCAAACGRLEGVDLTAIVRKVIGRARACRSGVEAEAAFMKLLATEGIAAPGAATAPADVPLGQPDAPHADAEPSPVVEPAIAGPTPFKWLDPDGLPRRQWLYGTFLIRKEVCATLAPGGVGKTSLGIAEALALASGKPLLGIGPSQRCRVWLWNGEEPMEEMQRRIMAACRHFGLSAADIEGWLFVDTIDTFDLVVAEESREGVRIIRPVVYRLSEWIKDKKIDVVFIDPFIPTHNVNENDNNAIQKAITAWKDVARTANCAISIAHHTRKLGGQAATAEDSRGAKSFSDKCRVARPINPMSKDEADRFGVPIVERRFYFSIDPTETKANMSAAIGGKEWFRSVSVALGAGRLGKLDFGDSVGVVERWAPPGLEMPDVTEAALKRLRSHLDRNTWRAADNLVKAPDWIGAAVAESFDISLADKAGVTRTKKLIAKLIADGVLVIVQERDPRTRKNRPIVAFADRLSEDLDD